MVIYDVYEELEKPNEWEILLINSVLDGKSGFFSYEEMEDIFHLSRNNKSGNSVVVNNGVTCENIISLNMIEEENYSHHRNQFLHSQDKDFNGAKKMVIVSSSLESNYESSKGQGNVKNNQRAFQFPRERSYFHNNVKMFYLSTTTVILYGYILLTSTLLMLLIYLQMLKKEIHSRLEDELLLTRGE